MPDEVYRVQIDNLPLTNDDNPRLRVALVPIPGGDNPWRTRGDYLRDQRRDTWRFWLTIASLATAIIGVAATTLIAIETIRGVASS